MTEQHIFDGDRDKLGEYVREMADLMGLGTWRIVVEDDVVPEDDGASADIHVTYGQHRAKIRFMKEWDTWEPSKLREIVAHELVHCFLDSIRLPLTNIRNTLGQPLYDSTYDAFKDYIEFATDGIAVAWAEFLPLPESPAVEEAA